MDHPVRLASVSELPPDGETREFLLGSIPVCIANVHGTFTAVGGVCPHRGGPLAEGTLEDGVLVCPWHGWEFRLADGKCINHSGASVRVFKLNILGNDVFLEP
jgi:nitrite reductase/ring-hydroxylating ferredoxin subunit